MGMAASQARYLGLTARKTNVEYEGQQVNQARTALANQAANTFNELLKLEVPVAPSQQDFVTMQYSYVDGTVTETISQMSPLLNDPDGYNYMVTHYHYADVYHGVKNHRTNPQVNMENNVPTYVGNSEVTQYVPGQDKNLDVAYNQIKTDFPDDDIAKPGISIYNWTFQGKTYFATYEDLKKTYDSAPDPSKPTENQDKLRCYNAQEIQEKVEQTQKAFVGLDESGRPQTIRYEDSTATYTLATERKIDEDAYQDAMNQYNYNMAVYEKKIQDINAKTEKIQEQDRTLELRLRQLDTEQEALQTEMEAVKKVIDKNIESTFKTFE